MSEKSSDSLVILAATRPIKSKLSLVTPFACVSARNTFSPNDFALAMVIKVMSAPALASATSGVPSTCMGMMASLQLFLDLTPLMSLISRGGVGAQGIPVVAIFLGVGGSWRPHPSI